MLLTLVSLLYTCHIFAFPGNIEIDKTELDFKAIKEDFDDFIKKYNKIYNDEVEYDKRLNIFADNLRKIKKLNGKLEKSSAGVKKLITEMKPESKIFDLMQINKFNKLNGRNEESYVENYGITAFTDLTPEEFRQRYTCFSFRPSKFIPTTSAYFTTTTTTTVYNENSETSTYPNVVSLRKMPREVDWVKQGYVTPVKNEQDCGSCWTFSAIGNVESQVAKKHGLKKKLSEQQLLDCVDVASCTSGGTPHEALQALADMGGVMGEENYPYVGKKEQCHVEMNKVTARVKTVTIQPIANETELMALVHQYGPVSVSMTISDEFINFKGSGVYVPALECQDGYESDHALLIVGYGEQNGVPYWRLKNSWGTSWGDKGFAKIVRGYNACNIANYVVTADIY